MRVTMIPIVIVLSAIALTGTTEGFGFGGDDTLIGDDFPVIDPLPTPTCPDGYTENPGSNTCFRFVPKKVDWFTAKADCESVGDSLPTFDNYEASEWFRLQQINHGWRIPEAHEYVGGPTWIGGHKVDGKFQWEGLIEGPLTLKRYTPGEPNNDWNKRGLCLQTWSPTQLWGDNPCERLWAYACERRKD